MSGDCPPPEYSRDADGRLKIRPHCWQCADKVGELLRNPQASEASSRLDPWEGDELVDFILANCKGTGRSYEWVVEQFSQGSVHPQHTPDLYRRRRQNLYVQKPRLERRIRERSEGKLELQVRRVYTGRKSRGKPITQGVLLVVPVKVKHDQAK